MVSLLLNRLSVLLKVCEGERRRLMLTAGLYFLVAGEFVTSCLTGTEREIFFPIVRGQ